MMTLLAALAALASGAQGADHPAEQALGDPDAAAGFEFCRAPAAPEAFNDTLAAVLEPDAPASEYEVAAALLLRAGLQIAAAHDDGADCAAAFADGARRFERGLARNTRRLRGQAARERASDVQIAEVQARIAGQWLADQAGRLTYVELRTSDREGAAFWAQRLATAHAVTSDADSTVMMRALLERFDWIDSHRFGEGIARHAWILVQHADDHPEFQALALERMAAYLDNGGVRARDYAYLFDRVAVNTGQPQRYATQPSTQCNEDGSLDLQPIEDLDGVDARRAEMGLGPYQAELDAMAAQRCG